MRNRAIALGALVAIVVVLIWNLLIFAPKGRSLSKAKKDTQAAQATGATLRSTLTNLENISRNGPAIAAQLDKLSAAVPASPDLDGFILSANQIAVTSGIDWLSVSPTIAQTGPNGVSTIPLSIQIKGGFFQVLDYLNRLEDMGRLVVVNGINITAGPSSSGPPILSVSLTAQMFTRAAPPPPAGSATTGTTSNTSTPPASGSSSGETSTTAQVQ